MVALLHRLRLALIGITAVTLILLAVVITILRLVLPMASEYRDRVAVELGDMLGQRVEIGALDARWRLLGPRVHLDDVAIFGPDDRPLLEVQRLDLGVRLWQSLWQGRMRFHSVRVLGADLHAHRDAEGQFRLSGAPRAGPDEVPDHPAGTGLMRMLAGTTFRLESSRLRYTDEVLGLDYRFDDLNLDVSVAGDALRLAGAVFLPGELGRELTLGVDLRGDVEVPESWRGQVHVRGRGIVIAGLPDQSLLQRLNARSGVVDVELWGGLASGRLDRLRAIVEAQDLRFGVVSGEASGEASGLLPDTVHLPLAAADGLWERRGDRGWQLRLHRARLQQPGALVSEMGVSLTFDADGELNRFWGEAEGLRLGQLLPLVVTQRYLEDGHRVLLAALQPSGEFTEIRFHGLLPDAAEPQFAATGAFRELAMEPHERIPGFHGLSGSFSVHHDGGELSIDSRNLRLDFPRLFADSLWVTAVTGVLDWQRTEGGYRVNGEQLRLHNEDLRAQGRLVLDLGGQPGIDLEVDFADGDGSSTARYLPVGIMPEKTHQWLSRSIVSGRVPEGRVVFRGPLKKFPLGEDEGVFEVRARVVDGVLDYQPGWPAFREVSGDLIFDDRGMRVENASGRSFDVRIDETRVRIADYRAAVLEVQGQARGPLADMLGYVRESPLAGGLDNLLDDTRAEGDSRLELSLNMPLHRRGGGVAATTVQGAVELSENRLRLQSQPVDFRRASGRVAFTRETVSAEGVRAVLNGESLRLEARMPARGPLTVRAEGRQPVSALATHLPDYLGSRLSGSSRWTGELTVPIGTSDRPTLRLDSMLEGVTSRLPEPLDKAPGDRISLRVELPLGQPRLPLRLRYGPVLSGVLRPVGDDLHGELRFNDGDAVMPEQGLRIAGRVNRADADAWLAVIEGHAPEGGAPPPGSRVSAVDLYLGEVSAGNRVLREIRVNATRGRERWQVGFDSAALRGDLSIPRDLGSSVPLTFNLERVNLDLMAAEEAASEGVRPPRLDPRGLPPLRGGIGELLHDGRLFRDVRLEATRMREGLQVHHLQASSAGGHSTLRITGDWRVVGTQHQTRFHFHLETSHVARMLTDLGFQHGFDRGTGMIDGQLRWPDAPTHFTWEGLQGNGRVEMEDGRLVEVDPGAGRLLGLFSLNMLPRRLALDFRDVFQRGFAFDRLTGTVRLADSDAYTSDLKIRGVAAHVDIEGRTGIVARDYDQRIVVTPRVGSTLPVAGALLGGPAAGAAVFILDRILGMGRSIDEASRVEYRVTGTWQDPVIEVLARPADEPS